MITLLLLAALQDPALLEKVSRSVVAIVVSRSEDPDGEGVGSTASQKAVNSRPEGPVSGVIYAPGGLILTSYFNVSGTILPDGIRVTLHDGRQVKATLLGWHQGRDIALLEVPVEDLPVLPKADPTALAQGTFVALVVRAPDPRRPTFNRGILSALHRMKDAAVQTDAEMNFGNAGGALVTLKGELVGVACHIRPGTPWGQSSGVGFACKTEEIDRLLDRLKKGERIEAEKTPFLGIQPGEGHPDIAGTEVAEVVPGSPAAAAGLKAGDVIVAIDDAPVTDLQSLKAILDRKAIGDTVTVKVRRPDKKKKGEAKALELKVTLEGRREE
jgi:serine protease DegQ